MSKNDLSFGQLIRSFRMASQLTIRQLAEKIGIAYGHLSDLERGVKPPPSGKIIINISSILNIDKDRLLQAAKKIDPQITDYVSRQPNAADFLRMAQERDFKNGDWDRIKKIVELSKLGKEKKK